MNRTTGVNVRARFHYETPGYDCVATPCGKRGCGTHPGANHGVHCPEWNYIVSDGTIAVSLQVFSGLYPRGRTIPPRGATMTTHAAFITDMDSREPNPCAYLDAGTCYSAGTTYCGAQEFFEAHGVPQYEQPESFWRALEAELLRRAKQKQDDRIYLCPTCHGCGTVPLPPGQLVGDASGEMHIVEPSPPEAP